MRMTTATSRPTSARSADSWGITLDYILGKKRAEEALGFLIACGGALEAAASHVEAVQSVLALSVPYLADWAGADFEPAPGLAQDPVRRSRTVDDCAPEQLEPLAAALAERIRRASPADQATLLLTADSGELHAVAADRGSGQPAAPRTDPQLADMAATAGIASALAVPLRRFDRQWGTLILLRAAKRSDAQFEAGPVELAVEVARRLSWVTDAFAARAAGPAAASLVSG